MALTTAASTPVRVIAIVVAIVGCLALLGSGAAAEPAAANSSGPSVAAPGDAVTVSITVTNTGAETGGYVGNVSLPANWTVEAQAADGAIWNSGDRAWLWQSIAPDSPTTATITATIPANATIGTYNVTTAVKSSDRVEATTSHTIAVENTSAASEQATAETAKPEETAGTDDRIPGFGVGTALVSLLAVSFVLRRVDHDE